MAASRRKPNYDSPWKEALEQYFPAFLQLMVPALYDLIDWSYPVTFLDKEFQAVNHGSVNGKRYADKLVQVRGKNAIVFWIVVHVEIQGGRVTPRSLKAFGARMFQYNYRIHDHYGQVIVAPGQPPQAVGLISLGVLTAGKSSATELVHQHDVLDLCCTQFRFPVVYLANWLERWDELKTLAATNPFAVLVMAQLWAQKAGKDQRQKLVSKIQIMRWLHAYRYSAKDTKQLLRLVDWMMTTPPQLEAELTQAMITIEQEQKMSYVTTFERVGQRKGLEKGLRIGEHKGEHKGKADTLVGLLTYKFGTLSPDVQERLNHATTAQLQTWSLNILDADSLDDVFTD